MVRADRRTPGLVIRGSWRRALIDPVYFAGQFLAIDPHPGQVRWLRHSTCPENLLHCGNRWGKSLVQAVKIAHRLLFQIRNPRHDRAGRYVCANVSITLDQARIIFNETLRLVRRLPCADHLIADVLATPFPMLRLTNGSILWARSTQRRGEYLLGHDFDFISFDEAAFEPSADYVVEEVLAMRVVDRAGQIDYVSTPRGKNWFYRKAKQIRARGRRGYVQRGDSRENPHLPVDYLESTIARLSPQRRAQNIEGRFVDLGNEVLREEDIQKALSLATGLNPPEPGRRYVHGWDLARKRSWTVGVTLDVTARPAQMVAFTRFQHRNWPDVFTAIRQRQRAYGGRVLIDATGLGDVVLSELADIKAEGYNFGERGGRAKSELIAALEQAFASGAVAIPNVEMTTADGEYWSLANELREFSWEDNTHCDAVFALALALWLARTPSVADTRPAFRLQGW
ncbi:MAG: terminase family protein [Candidatus Zixiibacteriota bacterium]